MTFGCHMAISPIFCLTQRILVQNSNFQVGLREFYKHVRIANWKAIFNIIFCSRKYCTVILQEKIFFHVCFNWGSLGYELHTFMSLPFNINIYIYIYKYKYEHKYLSYTFIKNANRVRCWRSSWRLNGHKTTVFVYFFLFSYRLSQLISLYVASTKFCSATYVVLGLMKCSFEGLNILL